jgi:vacuolar-type H+-ATPase catalytic subunit A/Vma1
LYWQTIGTIAVSNYTKAPQVLHKAHIAREWIAQLNISHQMVSKKEKEQKIVTRVGADQIRSDSRKNISTSYTYKKYDEHVYF